MGSNALITKTIALDSYGIKNATINYQLTSDQLHHKTIKLRQGETTSSGALAIKTGKFTGRSPLDRFIVKDDVTKDKVWWGTGVVHGPAFYQNLIHPITVHRVQRFRPFVVPNTTN